MEGRCVPFRNTTIYHNMNSILSRANAKNCTSIVHYEKLRWDFLLFILTSQQALYTSDPSGRQSVDLSFHGPVFASEIEHSSQQYHAKSFPRRKAHHYREDRFQTCIKHSLLRYCLKMIWLHSSTANQSAIRLSERPPAVLRPSVILRPLASASVSSVDCLTIVPACTHWPPRSKLKWKVTSSLTKRSLI